MVWVCGHSVGAASGSKLADQDFYPDRRFQPVSRRGRGHAAPFAFLEFAMRFVLRIQDIGLITGIVAEAWSPRLALHSLGR
ncbi:hypothetical protein SAMN04488061_0808 [Filomicrobium insigne]|uniref:Uncharacterized protein n=1 Tax=Filomicrobium insigne TaxID=418854 RepID=A0A1H0IC85_9HYPH|nr:hypothetical protein SAMN04488061_0808 [Filomicrobium insigne]